MQQVGWISRHYVEWKKPVSKYMYTMWFYLHDILEKSKL